jgi:serine/threonine protein kinase
VLLYRDKQTEQLVAVKLFKLTTCSQFEKEKQLLPLLCFQGVITLKAFGTLLNENGRRAPFLLLDFFENGSLYNLIDKTGALDDETAHYFFCKIVTSNIIILTIIAIQKIHDSDIVHRDIALGNIMLDDDFNPVLIDFAFAAHYKNKKIKLSDLVGTLPYMAPEILD